MPTSRINDGRVRQTTKLAQLDELLDSLPESLNTRIGERGIQIFGEQRRRIGIARALDSKGDMLVFDEPTNALGGTTNSSVMDSIHDFTGKNYCSNSFCL